MKRKFLHSLLDQSDRFDAQLIQIYARRAVYMEGCKKILRCDGERIELLGAFPLCVQGEGLVLKELGNNTVCAQGLIRQISFGE